MRSCGWLILKFSRDLSVWAPQYLSEGTWTSPKASDSVLVEAMCDEEALKYREAEEALREAVDLAAKALEEEAIETRGEGCLEAVHRALAVALGPADSGPARAELTLADRNMMIVGD